MTTLRVQALKLVRSGLGMGLTARANALVSRQAKNLLSDGLIAYGTGSVAYVLTIKGVAELAKHCDRPGCFAVKGGCEHFHAGVLAP